MKLFHVRYAMSIDVCASGPQGKFIILFRVVQPNCAGRLHTITYTGDLHEIIYIFFVFALVACSLKHRARDVILNIILIFLQSNPIEVFFYFSDFFHSLIAMRVISNLAQTGI